MSSRGGDMVLEDGRALSTLRVVDLKEELEKRGLSKSGSKKDLMERLKSHLGIEKQVEAAATDELPNISMQDTLAEQNPFIREYFASQAEQFHTQTVMKSQIYQVETSTTVEPVPEESPSMEKQKVQVIAHPVAPLVEIPTAVEPIPKEPSSMEKRKVQVIAPPATMPVEKPTGVAPEPEEPPSMEKQKVQVLLPTMATLVETPTVVEPIPEELQTMEKKKVQPPPVVVPVETPTGVEPIPEEPPSMEKQTFQVKPIPVEALVEIETAVEPIPEKPPSMEKQIVQVLPPTEAELVETPIPVESIPEEPIRMEKQNVQVLQPAVASLVETPPAVESDSKEPANTEKQKVQVISHPVAPLVEIPIAMVPNPEESSSMEKQKVQVIKPPVAAIVETPTAVEPIPEKTPSMKKQKVQVIPLPVAALVETPTDVEPIPEEPPSMEKQKVQIIPIPVADLEEKLDVPRKLGSERRKSSTEELKKKRIEPIVFDKNEKTDVEKRTRNARRERIRFDSTPDEPVLATENGGPENKLKNEPIVRKRSRFDSIPDEHVVVEEDLIPENNLKDEAVVPIPVVKNTSSDFKVKRTISIRTIEGIDDDVLDYGDEDRDRKEPQKFIWTPRTLRLNNTFQNEYIKPEKSGWDKIAEENFIDHNPLVSSCMLVTFYPDVQIISESELKLEERSPHHRTEESVLKITRTISNENETEEDDGAEVEMQEVELTEDLRDKVDIPTKQKITINPFPVEEIEKDLTPPRNLPTNVIIVTNLVRPFTLIQLRELLQRTGNIADFWVDKIKSKCIAKFEKDDEAYETRAALHGVRWPGSNPKTLHVDFTSEERLENLRGKESGDTKPKLEKQPSTVQNLPVREWDLGKRDREKSRSPTGCRRKSSRSVSRERKRARRISPEISRRKNSSRSPRRDRKGREIEIKKEPEASGKALDELFRKTTAVPCIYWLPLNPEQISEKEEVRRKRMLERERRISEMAKMRPR